MPLSRRYTPEWAPGEMCLVGMDFSFVVPPGAKLTSGWLQVFFNSSVLYEVSDDFSWDPITVDCLVLYTRAWGGRAGTDYQFMWTAHDDLGNVWPRTALMLCALTS